MGMRRPAFVVAPVAALALASGALVGASHDPPVPAGSPIADAIRANVPHGWYRIGPPTTSVTFPVERALLTSYPTRRGGNCGPERAARDLTPGGALIYFFEYRPRVGDPWANLRRGDFPQRPAHFALRRSTLGTHECWGATPSHLIRFRAADRPFQLHVALGPKARAARRAQVLRILDSLRISVLPPPAPDPFAGWRTLVDETGDSLRTPPRWAAAATTSPRRHPRPRALFFASNRRLRGLPSAPARSARAPRRLPSPFPAAALGTMAPDGVLLWVLEEGKGRVSTTFPRLPSTSSWPRPQHFAPTTGDAASAWPALTWERAAGSQGGHRFSVWIISGPGASTTDRDLARKAASTLALSTGSFRDAPCRRACRSG